MNTTKQQYCNFAVSFTYVAILNFLQAVAKNSDDKPEKKNVDTIIENFDEIYAAYLNSQTSAVNTVMVNVNGVDAMTFNFGTIIRTEDSTATATSAAKTASKPSTKSSTDKTDRAVCIHDGCTTCPKNGNEFCAKHKPKNKEKTDIEKTICAHDDCKAHPKDGAEFCAKHRPKDTTDAKPKVNKKKADSESDGEEKPKSTPKVKNTCKYIGCTACPRSGTLCAKHKKTQKNNTESGSDNETNNPSSSQKKHNIIIDDEQEYADSEDTTPKEAVKSKKSSTKSKKSSGDTEAKSKKSSGGKSKGTRAKKSKVAESSGEDECEGGFTQEELVSDKE